MIEGFIKVYRKIIEWEWYTDANTFRLFIHCLLKANYKEKKWQGIDIDKGSFITGRLQLAQELKLSEQQVRTSLNRLKSTNEITIKSTRQYSIITMNNYEKYNSDNQQANQQLTNKQPTANQQLTTTKNIEKEKNITLLHKVIESNFNFDSSFIPLIEKWIEYKKSKGQTYKNQDSLKAFINKLLTLSGANLLNAEKIIDNSMANSYQGIFALKDIYRKPEQIKKDETNYEELSADYETRY